MRALVVIALVGLLAACRDPAPPDGAITCGPGGTCPDGYHCVAGDTCYLNGHAPAPPDGGITCNDYCNCMALACNPTSMGFANETACFTDCTPLEANNRPALKCRLDHCIYARDGINGSARDPATHCPHAKGASPCNI